MPANAPRNPLSFSVGALSVSSPLPAPTVAIPNQSRGLSGPRLLSPRAADEQERALALTCLFVSRAYSASGWIRETSIATPSGLSAALGPHRFLRLAARRVSGRIFAGPRIRLHALLRRSHSRGSQRNRGVHAVRKYGFVPNPPYLVSEMGGNYRKLRSALSSSDCTSKTVKSRVICSRS